MKDAPDMSKMGELIMKHMGAGMVEAIKEKMKGFDDVLPIIVDHFENAVKTGQSPDPSKLMQDIGLDLAEPEKQMDFQQ